MGFANEKYTAPYFTGRHPDASLSGYGIEGHQAFWGGAIRGQDLRILERIDFRGKRVLEIGFGRGECIKYVLEHGAIDYEGVDLAAPAQEIARDFLAKYNLPLPWLHQMDALEFLRNRSFAGRPSARSLFDIVIMLDFLEHVPRVELREILHLLRNLLGAQSLLAINTPVFRIDNDVLTEGLDPRNHLAAIDTADLVGPTQGLHGNKYTVPSLRRFLEDCGYEALSEAHFYRPFTGTRFRFHPFRAHGLIWEEARGSGLPLRGPYEDDRLEYAFKREIVPTLHRVPNGRMVGLHLWFDPEYLVFFPAGNHDEEIFQTLIQSGNSQGLTFFDVGGFMGISSLLFARLIGKTGRVCCFEPNPWNQIRILNNWSHNPEEAAVLQLYPFALGNEEDTVEMLMSDSIDNGHSSTSQTASAHCTLPQTHLVDLGFFTQKVQATTIDRFVSETGIVPQVIKVDIEGAEHFFLEGAVETLTKHGPLLFIEIHSPFCAVKCFQILDLLGYRIDVINEEEDKRIMVSCRKELQSGRMEHSMLPEMFQKTREEEEALSLIQARRRIRKLGNEQYEVRKGLEQKAAHLVAVQQRLHEVEEQLEAAQNRSKTDQGFLADTQNQLHETQKALAAVQNRLTESQNSVAETGRNLVETQKRLNQAQNHISGLERITNHPLVRFQRKIWRLLS